MLKVKKGLILREIAGNWVVIPSGERVVECSYIISLNNCGSMLWKCLENGSDYDELLQTVAQEYDVDEATAKDDIAEFVKSMGDKGILEQC